MFTTSQASWGIRVPQFPHFGPRPSPHGPRDSPPRSPAPPLRVPFGSPDGPSGFPHGTRTHRPDRRCRGPLKGMIKEELRKTTTNGWAANAAQLLLAGPASPTATGGGHTRAAREARVRQRRRAVPPPSPTRGGSPQFPTGDPSGRERASIDRVAGHRGRPRGTPAVRGSRAPTGPPRSGDPGGPVGAAPESPRIPTSGRRGRPSSASGVVNRWHLGPR